MKHVDMYLDVVQKKKKGTGGSGTGGITPVGTKTIDITQNGSTEHDVASFAKAKVNVNVPQTGITPSGVKTITTNGKHDVTRFAEANVQVPITPEPTGEKVVNITANGTSTEDVKAFATAKINVNVPATGITPQGTKTITENGTHDVTQYAQAKVAVPVGITPTGVKEISVTQNGEVTEDVSTYKSVHIVTNVPEPSGTKQITTNGTHDVKAFASVNVNVPTGGGTGGGDVEALVKYPSYSEHGNLVLDLPNVTELRGYAFYKCFALGEIRLENISKISGYCFAEAEYLHTVSAPKVTSITGGAFNKTKNLKKLVLPSLVEIWPTVFDDSGIETLDMLGGKDSKIKCRFRWSGAVFKNLVIRSSDGIASLESGVDFLPTTSIYVPDTLVEQYKTATNWSKYASQIKPLSTYQEV